MAVALLLVEAAPIAHAQAVQPLDVAVDVVCSEMQPRVASMVEEHMVNWSVVCSCAKASAGSDRKLGEYLTKYSIDLRRPPENERVRSYIAGRLLQSIFSCYASSLDSVLNASTALQ